MDSHSTNCEACGSIFRKAAALKGHGPHCTPEQDAEIVRRYSEQSTREIALALGVSHDVVRNTLLRHGVKLRPVGRAAKPKAASTWYERGSCPVPDCRFEGDGDAVLAHALDVHGLHKVKPETKPRACARCGGILKTKSLNLHECDPSSLTLNELNERNDDETEDAA
jgi:hypothetical protein